MAYSYVKAIARKTERGARWLEVDISTLTIKVIFETYREVLIELSNPFIAENQILNTDDVRSSISDISLTLNDWLVSVGNTTLPTTTGTLSLNTQTAHYRDAWAAGYAIEPAKMGYNPDVEWPIDDMRDLLLTKSDLAYDEIEQYCLVTVNGYVHRIAASQYGVYVVDGAYSNVLSNETQVGILNFKDVGQLTYVDVDSSMLYRPHDEGKHYHYAYLNLGVSTEGKSLLMVMGGYLHVLDDTYIQVGDGLVRIDFNNYPMIQRYFDSKEVIDLSSLTYSEVSSNPEQRITAEMIASETWIEQMLDLSQTFFVLVDTPYLYKDKHKLEYSGLTGTFYSYIVPKWPVISRRGLMCEYLTTNDDGIWVVNISSNLIPNYQFEYAPYKNIQCVSPHKVPAQPYLADSAYFLEIGKDL